MTCKHCQPLSDGDRRRLSAHPPLSPPCDVTSESDYAAWLLNEYRKRRSEK